MQYTRSVVQQIEEALVYETERTNDSLIIALPFGHHVSRRVACRRLIITCLFICFLLSSPSKYQLTNLIHAFRLTITVLNSAVFSWPFPY